MNITVFCAANEIEERYTRPALEFARLLGAGGHTLVWGGSDSGLMGDLARGVRGAGGKLVGITVEFLAHKAFEGADEMVVTPNLGARKGQLLGRGDAIVVLVGGMGTLDEVTEILELKKHGHHAKPIVFLDTEGFYDGLRAQLRRMDVDGFLPIPSAQLAAFTSDPAEVLDLLTPAG
ncbi:LOG family protein [Phaeacidiphilus oryzae]|uniref:LOG family protein n=1 Tax=Phaeacidiphilus oryzae TaxID=348818 RepID=UPI00056136E7|nr:TIGR00730 family Rossman fold protein [Phaeacidiphilus oryzae]